MSLYSTKNIKFINKKKNVAKTVVCEQHTDLSPLLVAHALRVEDANCGEDTDIWNEKFLWEREKKKHNRSII